ncbi:MAG: hypothetical protein HQM10_23835 [Candidatus Riflebacteria bacterium]|nr:hypothetical protein [Candidatus Riflebacteria bacterium]
MRISKIGYSRSISSLLILSMMISFMILPETPAQAGMLSDFLKATRPLLKIAGSVGGAVAGATLASAIFPPVGMIAGGIVGWLAGGIIADYGTKNLSNVATIAGAAAGAMALGPGMVGMAGGALLGAFLGNTVIKIFSSADKKVSGGILLSPTPNAVESPVSIGNVAAEQLAVKPLYQTQDIAQENNTPLIPQAVTPAEEIKNADVRYREAYNNYIQASQSGDVEKIKIATQEYRKSYQIYQAMISNNAQ